MWQETARSLEVAVLDVLWAQWTAVGAWAAADRRPTSMIDPEALVLASLSFREKERRLWDIVGWWASRDSALLSVQRTRNLRKAYPPDSARALGEFAELAYNSGGDHRWKGFDRRPPAQAPRPSKVDGGPAQFIEPSTSMFRLRMGLGVGVKSDVLSFLIANTGVAFAIRDLELATGDGGRSVRRAANDLARCRFIRAIEGHPIEYLVEGQAWLQLLEISDQEAPPWRCWQQIFAFTCQLVALLKDLEGQDASAYVASSHLRQLCREHKDAFEWNRLAPPRGDLHPGEAFLTAFHESVSGMVHWIRAKM